MIIKGRSRTDGGQLARYLLSLEQNQVAELVEMRNMQSTNLRVALRNAEDEGELANAKKPLYHAQLSPDKGEKLTREQWLEAVDILERKLKFEGLPRAIVIHVKNGHEHAHVVWGRYDEATGKLRRDSFTKRKHTAAAREIEERFDLRRVPDPFAVVDKIVEKLSRKERRERSKQPETYGERQQDERIGADQAKARKDEITRLWQTTDNGRAFHAALEAAGYTLARGDRRGFVVVDQAGEIHSLPRQIGIKGVNKAQVDERLAHLDPANLPLAADIAEQIKQAREDVTREKAERTAKQPETEASPQPAPPIDPVRPAASAAAKAEPIPDEEALAKFGATEALAELTRQQSTFTQGDAKRLVERRAGKDAAAAILEEIARHRDFIRLGPDRTGRDRFSAREIYDTEQRMGAMAAELSEKRGHQVKDKIRDACPTVERLNDGQRAAFDHITAPGDLALVTGYAGAGKSFTLTAAREAWVGQGYRVIGAALSGKAAEELQNGSGIRSSTLHSLLHRIEKVDDRQAQLAALDAKIARFTSNTEKVQRIRAEMLDRRSRMVADVDASRLTKRDVVVLDEAAMVGSRQMQRLLSHVREAGAKVVLVGDAEQLQAIDAGGAFRALADRHGAAEITEVRRQKQEWQRAATRSFGQTDTAAALTAYRTHGRIAEFATQEGASLALIANWSIARRERPDETQIILTYTRAEVANLNALARESYRREGRLGADIELGTASGKQSFAAGDRIYFTQNDLRLGVKNGTLGTIDRIEGPKITVTADSGKRVDFDIRDYDKIAHGYAATVHKAQGVTVDRAFVLASRFMDRHAAYVGLTRHREDATLYWSRTELETFDKLNWRLSRDGRKDTTLDYQRRAEEGAPTTPSWRQAFADFWQQMKGIFTGRYADEQSARAKSYVDAGSKRAPQSDRLAELYGVKPDARSREERVQAREDELKRLREAMTRRTNRGYEPGM